MTPRGCFLGIERSLTGKRWEERLADGRQALALSQQFDLPEIVGRVLAARGVLPEEAERFPSPTLRAYLPDPSSLRAMDRAADRLCRAIPGGENVAVFGDYAVPGPPPPPLPPRSFHPRGLPPPVSI